jgi:hypothetical protein
MKWGNLASWKGTYLESNLHINYLINNYSGLCDALESFANATHIKRTFLTFVYSSLNIVFLSLHLILIHVSVRTGPIPAKSCLFDSDSFGPHGKESDSIPNRVRPKRAPKCDEKNHQ